MSEHKSVIMHEAPNGDTLVYVRRPDGMAGEYIGTIDVSRYPKFMVGEWDVAQGYSCRTYFLPSPSTYIIDYLDTGAMVDIVAHMQELEERVERDDKNE